MKKSPHKHSNTDLADSCPESNLVDFDSIDFVSPSLSQQGSAVGVLMAGFLTVLLLIPLTYFLVIKPLSQNAGLQPGGSPDQTASKEGHLVNGIELNLEAQHPNGTHLLVEGISFDSNSTRVQLTITNTRDPRDGLIRLNLSWGSIANTMILKDDFGEEYPLIASGGNPDVEVEPGKTLREEFTFRGKMNPSTQTVTLITNSKNGSPTNQILQTPLIEVIIPVNHTYP